MSPNEPDDDNLLPIDQGARVTLYHQTHHHPDSTTPVSLLPLLTTSPGLTHLIIAAFHLNSDPLAITLNDTHPSDPKFSTLWSEIAWLQASGVKCLAMLGGAAKGTYARLDRDAESFEQFYVPLKEIIRERAFDGIDLDVEEEMSLPGIIRLIDRFRKDFGKEFLITLAPVCTALLLGQPHLSGFSYWELERQRGGEIAWYNTQFYCGWGDASTTIWYDAVMAAGWKADRVVMGVLTNGKLGAGFVPWERLEAVLRTLRGRYAGFGGVMGWEYFCAEPGGEESPWEWVERAAGAIRSAVPIPAEAPNAVRPFEQALPAPAHPFPTESVKTLQELGFGLQQAVAALNVTSGNVEQAAGLLFED